MLFAFPRGSGLWTSRQPTVALFLRRETLPKENVHEKALFAVIMLAIGEHRPGRPGVRLWVPGSLACQRGAQGAWGLRK